MKLYLGSDFSVPEDAVTQTFAIFGKRGSGKSNAGTVLAEAMFKAHLPFVVLDPVDAWWGLKASFDGKGPGLAVYVFGGPHGDLPLEPTVGAMMADVLVEHRISAVLSFKGWSGGQRTRFASDFAERLLQRNSEPLHVFLEEADAFIPQRPFKGEEVMLGNFDRLVRWGRQSGLGCTLITQRSAKVNKDVTTQAETLIAFRVIGPQDRDAIDNWIKFHAGEEKRQEVLSSIATLKDGQAWVWSPEWLEILRRVTFRRRETYDSAATPKPGEKRLAPKQLAPVDLERLRTKMAGTIEKAKQDDPKELRRTIVDLRHQLKAKGEVSKAVTTKVERLEIPVMKDAAVHRLEQIAHAFERQGKELTRWGDVLGTVSGEILQALGKAQRSTGERRHVEVVKSPEPRPQRSTPAPRAERAPPKDGEFQPSVPQQRILDSLAWLESVRIDQAKKTQLALLAEQSPTSSGYTNNLGALRSAGLIHYPSPGQVALTEAGRSMANAPATPPTSEDLHESLFARLPNPQVRILKVLIERYGREPLEKAQLAELAGQSPTSSGFTNNLGSLRSLGLIDYPRHGHVAALPILFLEEVA